MIPTALRNIPRSPKDLFVRGALGEEPETAIAIVGTRRATAEGMEAARRFGRELAERGIVIVSGLAEGIDAAAHEGCLEGGGRTIAVLAGGLETIYPARHENLASRILEGGGALVSEYPAGTSPQAYRFLDRNRIVSGLSLAVLIVEAPERSGALNTASHAAEQGREVFVLPGPARHPNYVGSHALIRDGARLVTSTEDLLEDLGDALPEACRSGRGSGARERAPKTAEEESILAALESSTTPLDTDTLIRKTGLSAELVVQAVTFLTVRGEVLETERGYARR